ncbi:MAG: MlaE family lipid ABC transporter permease subunit [Rhodomicrobium sp.]|jgi:phospholipid/cholesterol/gamma-HCH transport system permease protein
MSAAPSLNPTVHDGRFELSASGSWTAVHAERLEALVARAGDEAAKSESISIDMRDVAAFDTFGAWLLERLVRRRSGAGQQTGIVGLRDEYRGLFSDVGAVNREAPALSARKGGLAAAFAEAERILAQIGRGFLPFLHMLGAIGIALARVARRPLTFRLTSAVHQLDRVGWQATPIILLMTFLIGCIIAQQGFFHFRRFGAESYVVDMVGILILREIGVLLVTIMVAGRSGSSYTAELGSMKMREEIDALRTMGLDPVEVLILPRVLALIVALPVLTFLGAMSALYGAGVVAWFYEGMSPAIFVARLHEAITVTHFEVGMIKAPFMAFVIGVVACAEGLQVKGSAESLGLQTTTSVVKSIFLVIVLDGLFAIFFASIGM